MERDTLKIIETSEISDDFPFRTRYLLEDKRLVQSIEKRGILAPLVLTGAKPKTLVSGHKRLQAAKSLGLKQVQAFEITAPSSQDLFLAAILWNWNQGWTELDRAWTIRNAFDQHKLEEKEVLEEVLPALGLPCERGLSQEYRRAGNLDASLLDLMASDQMSFRGCVRLARLSREDQSAFARVIVRQTALSASQLAQAGEWIYDLLKTKKTDLRGLLAGSDFEAILNHSQWDQRRKGDEFLKKLHLLRFPRLAARKVQFETFSEEIRRETKELELEAPPSFEEEGYWLHARIRKPESLDRVLEILGRKRTSLNSLFDIML